jgi:hypothetical protein
MSRKSGFSNKLPLERPCVLRQLPHHAEPLGGIRGTQVGFPPLLFETSHFDAEIPYIHKGFIAYPAFRFTWFLLTEMSDDRVYAPCFFS